MAVVGGHLAVVAAGAGSADIDVYDSAKKIDGIAGEALVLRVETDATGKMLSVAENFFVQNTSAPARTEYGDGPVLDASMNHTMSCAATSSASSMLSW